MDKHYKQLRVAVQDLLSELRIGPWELATMAKGYAPDYSGTLGPNGTVASAHSTCKIQISQVVASKLVAAGVNVTCTCGPGDGCTDCVGSEPAEEGAHSDSVKVPSKPVYASAPIREGMVRKGGVNDPPKTPRPSMRPQGEATEDERPCPPTPFRVPPQF